MDTQEFNKLLITFLANETCLWNPNDGAFNVINERHNAYSRIGLQLRDFGASDCQVTRVNDRFQALKRRFHSEYRKVQEGKQSTWLHYVQLEALLGPFVDKPKETTQKSSVELEPTCSNNELNESNGTNVLSVPALESRKRKQVDEDSPNKKKHEFTGIFDYMAIKLQEMDDPTQKGVIEQMLRLVHNPSIRLVDDQHTPTPIIPQWTVPTDHQY